MLKISLSKASRKAHMDVQISLIHEKTKSFNCTVYYQRFSQRRNLKRHITGNMKDRKFQNILLIHLDVKFVTEFF